MKWKSPGLEHSRLGSRPRICSSTHIWSGRSHFTCPQFEFPHLWNKVREPDELSTPFQYQHSLFTKANFCHCFFLESHSKCSFAKCSHEKIWCDFAQVTAPFYKLRLHVPDQIYSLHCSFHYNISFTSLFCKLQEKLKLWPLPCNPPTLLLATSHGCSCCPWVDQNHLLFLSHNPTSWLLRQQTPENSVAPTNHEMNDVNVWSCFPSNRMPLVSNSWKVSPFKPLPNSPHRACLQFMPKAVFWFASHIRLKLLSLRRVLWNFYLYLYGSTTDISISFFKPHQSRFYMPIFCTLCTVKVHFWSLKTIFHTHNSFYQEIKILHWMTLLLCKINNPNLIALNHWLLQSFVDFCELP